MKRILLLLVLMSWASSVSFAQGTTNYPTSLDTATTLPQAVDQKVTYLTAAVNNSITSLTVNSTAGVPTSGVLQVNGELMSYATADSTHFTVTRGFSGTTAASHGNLSTVRFPLAAAHVNGTRGAVLALEAKVGIGASNASGASTGHVLTKNGDGTTSWQAAPGGSGEANTASNVNAAGVGVFKQKTGVDLEFRGINTGSSKITVFNDIGNNEIDIDVAEANLTLNNLSGSLSWSKVSKTGSSLADLDTRSAADLSSGTLPAARMPALTGDVTTSSGAVATTLASVGTPGTYTKVTTDAKGRVTSGTTLSSGDIPTHTHSADDVTSGTLPVTRGGTGVTVFASVRAYNSTNLTISNATFTALTLDSERVDTDTIHSTASNTSRLTAARAGTYSITASVNFAANGAGIRYVSIRLNGSTYLAYQSTNGNAALNNAVTVTTQWQMSATDYVEIVVYQSSGASLDVVAAGNYSPEFMMSRIGP